MDRLSESELLFSFVWCFFFASRGSSFRTYFIVTAFVLCRVAGPVKHLPVHHHSADYIFSGPLESFGLF